MRTIRRRLLEATGVAIVLLAGAASAPAAPLSPADLHVGNGDGWHSDGRFALFWTNPAGAPTVAVHYLVRNPLGATVIGPNELAGPVQAIERIRVPDAPGAYSAEVWLEDAGGAEGPPATAKLRFDATRPAPVEPARPSGWIGRDELPYAIRISHPSGPPPASGIRGYAVSVDRSSATSPCAAADLCTDAETDLRGGADDDRLIVDELPEGVSYVHALAVTGSGMSSLSPGHVQLRVDKTDPVTRLSGAPTEWTNRTVPLEASATDSGSGMAASGDGAPFTAIRIDGGAPVVAAGSAVAASVIAPGLHAVAYYARDAAGNVDDGADLNGRVNAAPRTATVGVDRQPPTVIFVGSAYADDPELIEARVADGLSGPDRTRGRIDLRAAGSGDPYEPLATVNGGATLIARWDSDDFPVGRYEFRATGYDAAGNATVATTRANGQPMVLPNPLKARAILSAGFGEVFGVGTKATELDYGQSVSFGGRLTATSDSALGGKPITLVERFDQGAAQPRRTTVIDTDPEGRFSARLEPGASREVFAIFGGTRTATGTASRPIRLAVRSGVQMQASAARARIGGRPIVFRGSVASSPGELPGNGATVQLQFRSAGLPWSEFRTMQTDGRGRFRYAYRFSDDDSRGVRFRFRAIVPTQSDWPYEPGGSRPVAVRGT